MIVDDSSSRYDLGQVNNLLYGLLGDFSPNDVAGSYLNPSYRVTSTKAFLTPDSSFIEFTTNNPGRSYVTYAVKKKFGKFQDSRMDVYAGQNLKEVESKIYRFTDGILTGTETTDYVNGRTISTFYPTSGEIVAYQTEGQIVREYLRPNLIRTPGGRLRKIDTDGLEPELRSRLSFI